MNRSTDERVAEVAAAQHGVVTRAQAIGAGLTPRMIAGRLRSGRLRSVHRGVYRIGPLSPPRSREMSAVLACGPGAVVSHRSAAWLWDLVSPPAATWPVDVTVPGRDRSRRPGIRAHRVAALGAADTAMVEGIPVTAPVRTVVDLARVVVSGELERAVARAERQGLVTRGELSALIVRYRGRPGLPRLRAVVEGAGGPALTRSEAESLFLRLVRKVGLPAPEVNVTVQGYELDFLWPSAGIAVEVDGFAFHSSRPVFESDRRRDLRLAAAGIQVIRVTWRRLVDEPGATMVELGQTLALAEAT